MNEIFNIINGMSPYLLLGFLLAGLMHAFVPGKFYTKYLSRRSFRSVLNAALLGIPLPLCSCGVIPTAMSLRKEGASKGAVVSFLVATPQTGVDSIMATFSLMGLPFAILRPIAALVTAVFGGFITDKADKSAEEKNVHVDENQEHGKCCCHKHEHEEEHACHCHGEHSQETEHVCHCNEEHKTEKEHACCCHAEQKHEEETCYCHGEHNHETEHSCHCHTENSVSNEHKSFICRIKEALTYAYVDMMEDIGKWLTIGLIVAGLLTVYVPTEYFAVFQGNTFASILLVLCIAIPMYLCATGSIPIAVALMMKGLTPGAALVMLMAGPACNFASILVIQRNLGTRTMAVYLLSIITGAILFGCMVDWLQFSGHVDFLYRLTESTCSMAHTAGWFKWTCTGLLALMLINALVLPKLGLRKKKQCCHCH